jgi:hypothetical protein
MNRFEFWFTIFLAIVMVGLSALFFFGFAAHNPDISIFLFYSGYCLGFATMLLLNAFTSPIAYKTKREQKKAEAWKKWRNLQ